MHTASSPAIPRRSSRVHTNVPILVTSMDGTHFSEVCETLVVNAHGCALLSRVKFDAGVPLHFHSKDGRQTTAHVVSCEAVGLNTIRFRLGAKLDQPQNFWGLREQPKDWALPPGSTAASLPAKAIVPSRRVIKNLTPPPPAAIEPAATLMESQIKKMIADSVRPLQAEVAALKQQQAQKQANPSRFEVSLSSIPPELEQQLEVRLRDNLAPRLLNEAREQSAHLLEAAKAAIEQETTQGYEDFRRRSEEELKLIDKRAEDVSAHIAASARENLSRGLDAFQQKLLEGGNSLKRLSDELLEYLQQNLHQEHDARREDLERLRAAVASESSRLQEHVAYLDGRIAKLSDAAQYLESGLDQRLGQMASRTVTDARSQLEILSSQMLDQLAEKSVAELGNQIEAASEKLKAIQQEIVASVSQSLKGESAEAMREFQRDLEEAACHSVERWRIKLAAGLNALAKNIGEQFRLES